MSPDYDANKISRRNKALTTKDIDVICLAWDIYICQRPNPVERILVQDGVTRYRTGKKAAGHTKASDRNRYEEERLAWLAKHGMERSPAPDADDSPPSAIESRSPELYPQDNSQWVSRPSRGGSAEVPPPEHRAAEYGAPERPASETSLVNHPVEIDYPPHPPPSQVASESCLAVVMPSYDTLEACVESLSRRKVHHNPSDRNSIRLRLGPFDCRRIPGLFGTIVLQVGQDEEKPQTGHSIRRFIGCRNALMLLAGKFRIVQSSFA